MSLAFLPPREEMLVWYTPLRRMRDFLTIACRYRSVWSDSNQLQPFGHAFDADCSKVCQFRSDRTAIIFQERLDILRPAATLFWMGTTEKDILNSIFTVQTHIKNDERRPAIFDICCSGI